MGTVLSHDENDFMSDETQNPSAAPSDEPTTAPEPTQPTESTEQPVEEPAVKVAEETTQEPAHKAKLINFSDLKAGQTVRIHERIIDVSPKGEERQRIQVFEGMILGLRGSGVSRTLTVRKVSGGVGVEKIYPINSPVIAKIELVKTARVRRAKLSFITNLRKRFKRKLKETYEA